MGCATDLWAQGADLACGKDEGEQDQRSTLGACVNLSNDGTFNATQAPPFFRACEKKAYTFPKDDKANTNGKCKSGAVTCCVGTEADGCFAAPAGAAAP